MTDASQTDDMFPDKDSPEAVAIANEILAKHVDAIGSDVTSEDFNWNTDDSVVLFEQPETAVYFNRHNAMVIRQRGWPEDDTCIFIQPQCISEFIEQLTMKWKEHQ